jgi:uncharacterized membrane protein HdeD (DUF308 family)
MSANQHPFGSDNQAKTASMFLLGEGVLLVLLGLAAIAFPTLAGVATAVLLGWILMASGVVGLVSTFTGKNHVHFWWSLISSILAIAAGLVVAFHPLAGAVALVIVIAAWLTLDGVSTLMIALDQRRSQRRSWGWLFASALVDWLLAGALLFLSPIAGLLAIGFIVGIDLVFGGVALLMIGAAMRRPAP